jgi:hypothetical protein
VELGRLAAAHRDQPTFFSAGAAGAAAGEGFSHGMRARSAAPTFSIWWSRSFCFSAL